MHTTRNSFAIRFTIRPKTKNHNYATNTEYKRLYNIKNSCKCGMSYKIKITKITWLLASIYAVIHEYQQCRY